MLFRFFQARAFLFASNAPDLPADVSRLFRPGCEGQLRRLAVGDQRHLLAVHAVLSDVRAPEEVKVAGLLHDIGKARGDHRVRFPDRCMNVLLGRLGKFAPRYHADRSLAQSPPRFAVGLWLARNHAPLGAGIAHDLGYSPRVCWMILHHNDVSTTDPELALLVAADNAPPPRSRQGMKDLGGTA